MSQDHRSPAETLKQAWAPARAGPRGWIPLLIYSARSKNKPHAAPIAASCLLPARLTTRPARRRWLPRPLEPADLVTLLIRHAESAWNEFFSASRIDVGLPDPPLTARDRQHTRISALSLHDAVPI